MRYGHARQLGDEFTSPISPLWHFCYKVGKDLKTIKTVNEEKMKEKQTTLLL